MYRYSEKKNKRKSRKKNKKKKKRMLLLGGGGGDEDDGGDWKRKKTGGMGGWGGNNSGDVSAELFQEYVSVMVGGACVLCEPKTATMQLCNSQSWFHALALVGFTYSH